MYVEEKKLGETNIDDAGKVLLEAADYIERHGWCQHQLVTKQGEVCAKGAILAVLGIPLAADRPVVTHKEGPALWRVFEYWGCTEWGLSIWNDAPGRTKEQVVAALRGAARS